MHMLQQLHCLPDLPEVRRGNDCVPCLCQPGSACPTAWAALRARALACKDKPSRAVSCQTGYRIGCFRTPAHASRERPASPTMVCRAVGLRIGIRYWGSGLKSVPAQAELAAGLQTRAEREASLARLMAARQAMGVRGAGACAGDSLVCAAGTHGCRGALRPGALGDGPPGPGMADGAHAHAAAQQEQHDIAAFLQARRRWRCKAGLLCLSAYLMSLCRSAACPRAQPSV